MGVLKSIRCLVYKQSRLTSYIYVAKQLIQLKSAFTYSQLTELLLWVFTEVDPREFMLSPEPDASACDLRVIEKDGKFYCSSCERKYKNKSSCVRHFDLHLGRTTCSVCFKVFDTLMNLKAHFPLHLGSTTCQVCGRQLCNLTQLKYHMDHVHRSAILRKMWKVPLVTTTITTFLCHKNQF